MAILLVCDVFKQILTRSLDESLLSTGFGYFHVFEQVLFISVRLGIGTGNDLLPEAVFQLFPDTRHTQDFPPLFFSEALLTGLSLQKQRFMILFNFLFEVVVDEFVFELGLVNFIY